MVAASLSVSLAVLFVAPVPGPIVRGYQPPGSPYGSGHRGLDYAVAAGEPVAAVGDGVVVFAGSVGTTRHVTVRHANGWLTTLSFLATVTVRAGQTVRRGQTVGTGGGIDPRDARHDGTVVHLGLRIDGSYADPARLFGPPDLAAIVRLAPVPGEWAPPGRPAPPDRPAAAALAVLTATIRQVA